MRFRLHPPQKSLGAAAVAALCLGSFALAAPVPTQKRPPARRATPPTWSPRDLETFFPDARRELVGDRPQYGRGAALSNTPPAAPGVETAPPAPASRADWPQTVSAETLADEVKSYAPLLAAELKSPSHFKGGGAKNARRYFSMLAASFAVLHEYPTEVRWKSQAAAARDLFARAGFNSKTATDGAFQESRLRHDDLQALLRGEQIQPPSQIEPSPLFNDKVANRPPLMWRMERAQQERLSAFTADEATFKKNLPAALHEAQILAMLAALIQRDGYPDADSDSYQQYANETLRAAQDAAQAIGRKDYAAARAAVSEAGKACVRCHGEFRGG